MGSREDQLSWFAAEAKAIEVGGHLLEIHSPEHNRLLDVVRQCKCDVEGGQADLVLMCTYLLYCKCTRSFEVNRTKIKGRGLSNGYVFKPVPNLLDHPLCMPK